MKSVGIVRNVDDLGRVVLPKEMRDMMGLNVKDPVEYYVDEDKIILKEYSSGCLFCGSVEDKVMYKDKFVCRSCVKEMRDTV